MINQKKRIDNVDHTSDYTKDDFAEYGVSYDDFTKSTRCLCCGKRIIQPKPSAEHPFPKRFCSSACAYKYYNVDQRSAYSHWVRDSFRELDLAFSCVKKRYDKDLDNLRIDEVKKHLVRQRDTERIEDDCLCFSWDKSRILTEDELDNALHKITYYIKQLVHLDGFKWRAHDIMALGILGTRMWLINYIDKNDAHRREKRGRRNNGDK